MEALDAFLETYGLAAACVVILTKSVGVPLPVPGDVILLATAARAAQGKILLSVAFIALLVALTAGGALQFLLARGPARQMLLRYGRGFGLTEQRLERVANQVQRGGLFGIGLAVLTPGVRTAAIPACGIARIPLRIFLPGLALGSAIDLALHFVIGYAGASILATVVAPSPLLVIVLLAIVGVGAWIGVAYRRGASTRFAVSAWAQATCPACLVVGSLAPLDVARPARPSTRSG